MSAVVSSGTPRGNIVTARSSREVRAETLPTQPNPLASPTPATRASPTTAIRTCPTACSSDLSVVVDQSSSSSLASQVARRSTGTSKFRMVGDELAHPFGQPREAHVLLAAPRGQLLDPPVGEVHDRHSAERDGLSG
jgi:hypothetical protein